jgi:restriction endonuclease S subunit
MQYLIPKEGFDIDFIKYFLEGIDFEKHRNGSTIPHIYFKDYKSEKFPKIPLPEQQRIVSILDRAFAAIDKAKANAEQNLQNAKELFESYLQGVFENGDFKTLEFGKVCELVGGSQPSKKHFIYEPKDSYIRLIQVRDYRTDKFTTYIPESLAKRFCDKNDIMIGRYGPPIFGIFKGLEGAYNVALMKAVVNEKLCDKTFFYWFLQNNKIRKFVEHSSKRAVGQDGVRKELLEKYPVPVPSINEQQTIVRHLDDLRSETQKLEAVYQKKMDDLEELKKSILQKAFAGELTQTKHYALHDETFL